MPCTVTSLFIVILLTIFSPIDCFAQATETITTQSTTKPTMVENAPKKALLPPVNPNNSKVNQDTNTPTKLTAKALSEKINQSQQQDTSGLKSSAKTQSNITYQSDGQLEYFEQAFNDLHKKVINYSRSIDEYGELYSHIRPIIIKKNANLINEFSDHPPNLSLVAQVNNYQTFQKLLFQYAELKNFFILRENLFNEASDEFIQLHTSTKLNGLEEAELEYHFIKLQVLIMYHAAKQRILEVPLRAKQAPLALISTVFTLVIAILFLTVWRRWAAKALPNFRKKLQQSSPRNSLKLNTNKLLWYFDQVRSPVEWYLFFNFLVVKTDFLQLPLINEVLKSLIFWVCVTSFGFKLLNSFIERRRQGILSELSNKQSASLRLLLWWAGLFLLSTEVIETFISHGTILSWCAPLFLYAIIPLYIFIVYQWRRDTFEFIENDRDCAIQIKALTQHKKGIKGFITANVCILYVFYFLFSKSVLKLLSGLESGRRLTTELYRSRLEEDNKAFIQSLNSADVLNEERRQVFVKSTRYIDKKVLSFTDEKITAMLAVEEKTHVAIVGERGIGKTTIMTCLHQKNTASLLINCNEDCDEIIDALKKQLAIEVENVKAEHIAKAIKEQEIKLILLDNCHHLATPTAGGQRELKRLYGLINELKGLALWVLSFEKTLGSSSPL